MPRTDRGEMPVIERCELLFSESLEDRHDRGVDKAEPEIGVSIQHFQCTNVISMNQVNDAHPALYEIGQERKEGLGTEPATCEPVEFDDDRSRDEQLLSRVDEHLRADIVIAVGAVDGCIQRAGIADQRQERGSYPNSSARLAVSVGGPSEAPAAMNRRVL